MNGEPLLIDFTQNDGDQRVVSVSGVQAKTPVDLIAAAPDLKNPENLGLYCDALNYLARGNQYRPIHEPEAFRAHYEKRFQAEDPNAPFQEGKPRLRDFGHCQLEEIQAPSVTGSSVVFYVEDSYLGIPYRVTAPAPEHPEGETTYEPVPMSAIGK